MNQHKNPYQSPKSDSDEPTIVRSLKWRGVVKFNCMVAATLVAMVGVSFLWSRIELWQMEAQLGRHYATYDHEYTTHFDPFAGLILIATIFTVANLVYFAIERSNINEGLPGPANKKQGAG